MDVNDVAGTPVPDPPHVHRWKVGSPLNGVSVGVCDCGTQRTFTDEDPARPLGPHAQPATSPVRQSAE